MFTGIVDHRARIELVEKQGESLRLGIASSFTDLKTGESISVDGVCLTVVQHKGGYFQADVSPETRRLTIASAYEAGQQVNVERALRLGDRMGGHWVTGHVDATLCVSQVEARGDCVWFRLDGFEPETRPLIARKGWVSVNGVSLTVNEVGPSHFELLIVPHTLANTGFGDLNPGSRVNVEWDWMAKMVFEALRSRFVKGDRDGKLPPVH
ncbi:riboflavin synthase [bacterium]|nr:riboflavin synthase [bacterium]